MSDAMTSMIEGQIKPNKVTDESVIEAFRAVPRDSFVPKSKQGIAYIDEDLEVAPGRFIMEPMILARLIETAQISSKDMILDVGCTTGYSTVILAQLGNVVVGLEEDEELATRAEEILESLGVENAAVITGSLKKGAPLQGPFQVIFLNGAVEQIPSELTDQLADGGRLVTVLIEDEVGHGYVLTKINNTLGGRKIFDCAAPILPGFKKDRKFRF